MDHYRGESQNLTTAAEANMLKLREMLGTLDETAFRAMVRRQIDAGMLDAKPWERKAARWALEQLAHDKERRDG